MLTFRSIIVIVLLSVLVFSPAGVLAKEPVDVIIRVHNQTGADAIASVQSADGATQYLTLPAGSYPITFPEGRYSYYITTICGNTVGQWNLNVTKDLWLECQTSIPAVSLTKSGACNDYGVYVWINGDFMSKTFWEDSFQSFGDWVDYLRQHHYNISIGCLREFDNWGDYFTYSPG